MSTPKKSDPADSQGVLSKLPRTRPQRSSPRRAAARKATAAADTRASARPSSNGRTPAAAADNALSAVSAATKPPGSASKRAGGGTAKRAGARTTKRAGASASKRAGGTAKRAATKRPADAAVAGEPVPKQGFECDSDRASGAVQPPGGTELVAGAAEIIGELAKAGLSTGERLLKDVLSRLPLS